MQQCCKDTSKIIAQIFGCYDNIMLSLIYQIKNMNKEQKATFTFSAKPSIVKEAKDNVWKERTSLSEKIEELLTKYNKTQKKIA